jgi:hypothetical protein
LAKWRRQMSPNATAVTCAKQTVTVLTTCQPGCRRHAGIASCPMRPSRSVGRRPAPREQGQAAAHYLQGAGQDVEVARSGLMAKHRLRHAAKSSQGAKPQILSGSTSFRAELPRCRRLGIMHRSIVLAVRLQIDPSGWRPSLQPETCCGAQKRAASTLSAASYK